MQNNHLIGITGGPTVAAQTQRVLTIELTEEECNVLVNFIEQGIKAGGIPAAKAGLPLFDKINRVYHNVQG